MNIKKTTLLFAFVSFFSASIIQPDGAHKNSGTTIVTIQGQRIIQESHTGKKIQKKLQDEQEKLSKPLQKDEQVVREREQKLQESKKELDKEAEELAKSTLLSQDAKQRKYEVLQDKARRLEEDKAERDRLMKRLQEDAKRLETKMTQMYQEEMGKFDTKIKDIIKQIAVREGWDIVLMEESVVYASKDVSKTDFIIKELDGKEAVEGKSLPSENKLF